MQQTFKTQHPLKWMFSMLVSVALFAGCNGGASKTDTTMPDSSSSKMAPADSSSSKMVVPVDTLKPPKDTMPPLDTTVRHRPENIKARKS